MKFKYQYTWSFVGTQPHPFIYASPVAVFTAYEQHSCKEPNGPQSVKYLLSCSLQRSLPTLGLKHQLSIILLTNLQFEQHSGGTGYLCPSSVMWSGLRPGEGTVRSPAHSPVRQRVGAVGWDFSWNSWSDHLQVTSLCNYQASSQHGGCILKANVPKDRK